MDKMAKELIDEHGGPVDLLSYVDAPADPLKPWEVGDPQVVVQSTRGVFLRAKRQHLGANVDSYVAPKDLPKNERRLLLAALNLAGPPTLKDRVRVGAEIWSILSIVPIAPSGVDLLYILQVRQ